MGITLGGRCLRMAKHLSNQIERVAIRDCEARETMAKVMQSHALEPRRLDQLPPYGRHATVMALTSGGRENPWRGIGARQLGQHVQRGRAQRYDLRTRLGVGKPQRLALEIDMLPPEGGDFIPARTGQDQQANDGQ